MCIRDSKEVGLYHKIAPYTIPMNGRNIHDLDGSEHLQPYGQKETEVIYSISRAKLNMEIMTLAESTGMVQIFFNHRCTNVSLNEKLAYITDENNSKEKIINFDIILGVDGSDSVVREAMIEQGGLDYVYKPVSYTHLTLPTKRIV